MMTPDLAPPQAIAWLRFVLACSNGDLAQSLVVSPRTLLRWEAGATRPQHAAQKRLSTLVALSGHLIETFGSSEAVHAWLQTNSRYLAGATPADTIRAGRFDRVDGAVEALDSGIFI